MLLNDRKITSIKLVWLVLCVLLVLVGIPFPKTTAMAASGTYQYTSATNPVSAAGATTDDGVYRYITDIDLEGDGDRDFIGYYDTTNDGVYNGSYDFFVNNGSGTFSRVEPAGITLPLTNGSSYLCTDFDNDGDDDIFAADPDTPGAGAYYTNNGSGIFTSAANPLAAAGALTDNGGEIYIIDIDLEGDGDRDFIAYYNAAGYHEELNNDIYNGGFNFFVNNGSGSFSRAQPAGITLPLKTGDNYICADFDNDGDEDIFAPGGYFTNDGTGNFTSATNPVSAAGATTNDSSNRYISDIDLDSDGDIDFIAYDGSIYAFYMNNGSGSFTKDVPTNALPINNANEYLCTDFDNDGDEDIFAPGGYFIQGGTSAATNNRPPRKSGTSPADNATGVSPTENISISFDETITDGGSGRINIYQSVGDTLVESIPGNDARVSGFGTSTISINPNATFSGNTQYYVIVEVGALFDDDGMTFAGIDTNTEFNFEAGIPDSTAPTVDTNTGLTLNEGATAYLTSSELDSSDDTAGASDITYTVTSDPSNGSLSHSVFTQAQLDLGNVVSYTHNDSNTTSDSFTFKVSDGTNELTGQTFNITVTPVNDDPTITGLPTDITVTEDMPGNVDLSAATIYDDSGSSAIALSMISSEGTLSASSGGGVTVSGSGTSTLTLSGTVANIDFYINTASNIRYTGAANANGNDAATLTLIANDGGNTGSGGGTNVSLGTVNIDITAVNDDPTITGLPTDISVVEDTPGNVDLSAAIISDVDSGSSSITLSMTTSEGILSASSGGGVTVSGSGTSTLTLSGTAANIDSYINIASNIMYTGASNANGNDAATLTITANDGGNTGAGGGADVTFGTVNVDITSVNDVPTLVANAGISLNEGAAAEVTSTQLSATDVETADGLLTYTVTTGSVNGQLENTDNPGVSISGFTQQNIIDGKIQYVHNGSNITSDSFTFKVSDSEGGVLTGQMFSIMVTPVDDDVPTIVTNNGLTLNEGATKTIPLDELEADDVDTDNATLTYTVTDLPDNGVLKNSGSTLILNGTFTQGQLDAGNISYTHDGTNTTFDSFTFKVGDGAYNELTGQTFNITVIAIDDDVPTITTNNGLTLNEGATKTIPLDELEADDVDTDNATLTYTVTSAPSNGQLENTDTPGVSISSFTQQNIIDGKIQYVHDGSNTTSDSFTFKVSDGMNELTGQTFSITVNAIDDDAPTMVNNMGLTLDQGTDKTITTAELLATDTETADTSIVYTVMDLPDNGELSRGGLVLALSGTFTQQDIIDGKIQYAHDGSTMVSDSFDFKVADSNANELTGQTFNITINSATIPTPTPIPTPVPTITPSPTQTPGKNTRTINGTLLDEEGNPKVGYVVELHSTPITTITDSQGRYRFDNVNYTAHTLFIKTPLGQQIASFALSFNEGDEFEKSVTGEAVDITYTKNTVSVDITIALDGDEDSAEITELSGVDNPATGRTHIWWMLIVAAVLIAGLIGLIVKKRISARS